MNAHDGTTQNHVAPPSPTEDRADLTPIHPCARCATLQRTCCQRADILVTDGDIQRIREHTKTADFWEYRAPASTLYTEHDPDDPNWIAYTQEPDGTRRVLKRHQNGDCTFLSSRGCSLPTEVRPLVCRLYPHAYNESGLRGEDPDYCPTNLLTPPQSGRTMLKVLDMKQIDGERWRATLYAELRERAMRQNRSLTPIARPESTTS